MSSIDKLTTTMLPVSAIIDGVLVIIGLVLTLLLNWYIVVAVPRWVIKKLYSSLPLRVKASIQLIPLGKYQSTFHYIVVPVVWGVYCLKIYDPEGTVSHEIASEQPLVCVDMNLCMEGDGILVARVNCGVGDSVGDESQVVVGS